jgi:hypothetical protein
LARELALEAFPELGGKLQRASCTWDLHTLEMTHPQLDAIVADFALAQDGTWTYLVSLATPPDEHESLHQAVLLPVVESFTLQQRAFGCLGGGPPSPSDSPTLAERLGYSREDVLLIVHADDVGAHRDQTDGTLEAMEIGLCKTGSVMVPCPDFPRLLSIWQDNPGLDLGIHLTLNSEWGANYGWPPVLPRSQVPSLYSPEGIMWPTEGELKGHMDVREALLEVEAQITRVLEAGLDPTHVDDHMGCYWQHPDLADGVMALAKKYNLPMNPVDRRKMRVQGYVYPDAFWMFTNNLIGEEQDPGIRFKVYDDWLRGLEPGVHQVMTHIARVTPDYATKINGAYFRAGDYAYWTRPQTRALADELGVTFIGYRELQRVQAEMWTAGMARSGDRPQRES